MTLPYHKPEQLTETLDALYQQLERAVTPAEYDRLTEEIANAKKQGSIAKARQIADANVKLDKTVSVYKDTLKKIEEAYQEIGRIDARMFKAVSDVCEIAIERQEASRKAEDLESLAHQASVWFRSNAPHLGIAYERKQPALFGGPMIRPKLNDFLKVWLQRYLDYRTRLGREKMTLEAIAPHGLQGSTETEDRPSSF